MEEVRGVIDVIGSPEVRTVLEKVEKMRKVKF